MTVSHVAAAGILSHYIDFDEQIPPESPLSTPHQQVQVHHISTGSPGAPPWHHTTTLVAYFQEVVSLIQ